MGLGDPGDTLGEGDLGDCGLESSSSSDELRGGWGSDPGGHTEVSAKCQDNRQYNLCLLQNFQKSHTDNLCYFNMNKLNKKSNWNKLQYCIDD